jgi:hypothetical protein
MSGRRICAYCGASSGLTKEHLIPAALIQRTKSYTYQFSAAANNVIGGEAQIRDVCDRCNSGPLPALDAYACTMYDKYCSTLVEAKSKVAFEYDYDYIVRWLLKMSYNAARTTGKGDDAAILARHAGFILGREPQQSRLAAYLQLVIPYIVSEEDEAVIDPRYLKQMPLTPNGRRFIPSSGIRISRATRSVYSRDVVIRVVALNSYYFYLVIPRNHEVPPKHWQDLRQKIKGNFDRLFQLTEQAAKIEVRASNTNCYTANEANLKATEQVSKPWHTDHLRKVLGE